MDVVTHDIGSSSPKPGGPVQYVISPMNFKYLFSLSYEFPTWLHCEMNDILLRAAEYCMKRHLIVVIFVNKS